MAPPSDETRQELKARRHRRSAVQPSDRSALTPGTRVGSYEIRGLLGSGGLGKVYRAWDAALEREVAIKALIGEADDRGMARFQREARTLAMLDHPNIVTIHSIERKKDRLYLVMELIDGAALDQLIPEAGLPLELLVSYATTLAEALVSAHERGIVHRDLKPANVMMTRDGRLKVLDFGLARPTRYSELSEGLTREGAIVGTVPYMSPEQLRGRSLDQRSDLFSFGIVLYEMATGRRPFTGTTAEVITALIATAPARPSVIRPGLPVALDAIVSRCLEKEPEKRYQSGRELCWDLEQLRGASAAQATMTPVRTVAAETTDSPTFAQEIRFCKTKDGYTIAYATAGSGPPLVRVLGWFTHLEKEWQWPAARRFWERFARRHRLIRYDGRGIGLSACEVDRFTLETRLEDLSSVVDAIGLDRFALMGMSEGGATAAAYAARHPDRVTHLILAGAFPSGKVHGEAKQKVDTLLALMAAGWGQGTPLFQNLFAQLHLGMSASPEALGYFNEMQRASALPAIASRYYASNAELDVREDAAKVTTPTLIVHRRDDLCVPFEAGRSFAKRIPGSRLVPLKGDNHWLLYDDEGAPELLEAIEDFIGTVSGTR